MNMQTGNAPCPPDILKPPLSPLPLLHNAFIYNVLRYYKSQGAILAKRNAGRGKLKPTLTLKKR